MTRISEAYQALEALPASDLEACSRVLLQFLDLQGGRQDILIHTMARTFETASEMSETAGELGRVRADWYAENGRKLPDLDEALPA